MRARMTVGTAYKTGLVTATLIMWCGAGYGSSAQAVGGTQAVQPAPFNQGLTVDRLGLTIRYPSGWSASQTSELVWLVKGAPEQAVGPALDRLPQIYITNENRRDHADAVRRLREIASEYPGPVTYLAVGGWPAIQRRVLTDKEQPGVEDDEDSDAEREPAADLQPAPEPRAIQLNVTPNEKLLKITTVVAAGNRLVRAEGRMPPDAGRDAEDQVRAIESATIFRVAGNAANTTRELRALSAAPRLPPRRPPASNVRPATPRSALVAGLAARSTPRPSGGAAVRRSNAPLTGSLTPQPGLAQRVIAGGFASEAEIAVSTDGQKIVIAQQFLHSFSIDGGQTFTAGAAGFNSDGGDASLAFGRSGNFYEGTILKTSSALNMSIDGGKTFTARASAFTCPTSGPNQCGFTRGNPPAPFPDQEHIAADRFNATSTGDQVYFAWRQGNGNYGIACSTNSGQNFGGAGFTTGDFPRITVGQDGFVYVVYVNGGNVNLNKYSSCQAGLAVQTGFPVTVATGIGVTCPVAGLDRCNNGNQLHSHMVAVDDTNANHIFVAYAQSAGSVESVLVQDSTDGGQNWPGARVVTVSSAVNARRFMPWVCAAGGVAYASWFDRRAATATNDSLTDYYSGSAFLNGSGNLVAGPEIQVNTTGSADNECNAGRALGSTASWPSGSRAPGDSNTCQPQPQLAGQCKHSPPTLSDSNNACDFLTTVCPATETCQTFGGGVPKYGDYNGNACVAGRFYAIWPSATPPAGTAVSGNVDLYFSATVVASAQIQIPGPVVFPDTCVGTTSIATANVCNTGKTDLHISPITSSNSQFAVFTPSSGYPVTIGPSECFPFEVRFTPTGPGAQTATLTVPSDDSVNPSASIAVSGNSGTPTIATMVADAGDFGESCPGSFRDRPLTINNAGSCPLRVTNLSSSASDFQTASVVSFPLVVAPGTSVEIPIRFRPSNPGAKAADISISSSDPANPLVKVHTTGTGGQPRIVTAVVDTGSFGRVCQGASRTLPVTISNSGLCPLSISSIASSSPEFEVAQVLTFPLVVAPGGAIEIPIRFAPTTPGTKSATITIASNDPTAPSKVVTLTGETPPDYVCHPPTFAALSLAAGPTFGDTATGDWTFAGQGHVLVPFGQADTSGVEARGEFLEYDGRREGQIDVGLLQRWRHVQGGAFVDVKSAEVGSAASGGTLGQAAFTLDVFRSTYRINAFVTRGFHDAAQLGQTPSFLRIVDQAGAGAQVRLLPRTYVEGNLAYLHGSSPLTDHRVGAMLRGVHQIRRQLGLTVELTVNETLVGPTNDGRVVFGLVIGRWAEPRDLSNKLTPLGTDIPRLRFEVR
jgi:hypothetical protein